jgi:hypothetical protein
MTAQERLASMTNRATLYEIAMSKGDTRYLLCYTNRRGRAALFDAVARDAAREAVKSLTGTDQIHFARRSADGATMGEWRIQFTGRTQREAIGHGELTRVWEAP